MGAKLAGGGGKKKGYSANSEPNVIPFIDILLVLLIIFMVAAPIPTTDVRVDLPPPVPPENIPQDNKRPTIVDVRDEGGGNPQIFVDGTLIDESELATKVLERVPVNVPGTPNPLLETIRLRADQTLSYATVMRIMADLQEAQFQKVSLVAETALTDEQMAAAP
jgi:biopolymer transport protein ExbD